MSLEPDNDNKPLEFWLDRVDWPAPDGRFPLRLLQMLDARAADMPDAFMIPVPFHGRSVAFGARGLLMTALALGLCAGAATAGAFGGRAGGFLSMAGLQASAADGPALVALYDGDGL